MGTTNIIPKIIHYCWFGGNPLPPLAEKCIASWKKHLPDFEIKRWDESNFDVDVIPYTKQAYKAKRYAFVSDYARLYILHKYGGLYFDTDVEVIKPMNHIIVNGPFMGCENPYIKTPDNNTNIHENLSANSAAYLGVNPGLGLGAYPEMEIYKELLDYYNHLQFRRPDGSLNKTTIVTHTMEILCRHGLRNTPEIQTVAGIKIYPVEYFCPMDYATGHVSITSNTVSIHHYTASWKTNKDVAISFVAKILGKKITNILIDCRDKLNKLILKFHGR